jgi:hypothetical protein
VLGGRPRCGVEAGADVVLMSTPGAARPGAARPEDLAPLGKPHSLAPPT